MKVGAISYFILSTIVLATLWLVGCADRKPSPQTVITMEQRPAVMERSHVVLPTVREFGIYTRKGEKRMIGDTNAVENSVTLYSGPFTFEQITRDIPARLNTSFGFRYQLSGLPPLGKTNVQCVVTHPEITNANGKVTTTTAWKTTVVADTNGVVQGLMGYAFQKPYEMVLGRWVMHLYMDNKIQLRVSFNVTAD